MTAHHIEFHLAQVSDPTSPTGHYEIRVTGHLAARWCQFFDGMTLAPQDDGTTVIHGPVADQSALHGLIRKLSDLGLPLVSVTRVSAQDPTEDDTQRRSTT